MRSLEPPSGTERAPVAAPKSGSGRRIDARLPRSALSSDASPAFRCSSKSTAGAGAGLVSRAGARATRVESGARTPTRSVESAAAPGEPPAGGCIVDAVPAESATVVAKRAARLAAARAPRALALGGTARHRRMPAQPGERHVPENREDRDVGGDVLQRRERGHAERHRDRAEHDSLRHVRNEIVGERRGKTGAEEDRGAGPRARSYAAVSGQKPAPAKSAEGPHRPAADDLGGKHPRVRRAVGIGDAEEKPSDGSDPDAPRHAAQRPGEKHRHDEKLHKEQVREEDQLRVAARDREGDEGGTSNDGSHGSGRERGR